MNQNEGGPSHAADTVGAPKVSAAGVGAAATVAEMAKSTQGCVGVRVSRSTMMYHCAERHRERAQGARSVLL